VTLIDIQEHHRSVAGVACVVLSGGMDSTACLHWALHKFSEVRALGFDYGQPHRDAELVAAGRIAARNSVPFATIALADTLHSGLLSAVPQHVDGPAGPHPAFIPFRNLVFLSVAGSRALRWWPGEAQISLVFGACLEDANGFKDCRQDFVSKTEAALNAAVDQTVRVHAPYSATSKRDIISSVMLAFPSGLADLQESWSCYAGKGPCGTCTPCVLRRSAFEAHGLVDNTSAPRMTGGDVSREQKYFR
jgi:7-cyano-7-deazaguanine synthase